MSDRLFSLRKDRRPLYDRMAYGAVLAILGLFIVQSHPFMKIPYDAWEHLLRIASIYDEGKCFVFWPDDTRIECGWHAVWAALFRLLDINDFFIWAEVIHTFQFFFTAIVMLYSTGILLSSLLPDLKDGEGKWLSLIAVILWFLGNGTHSIEYQQAWIMWYSVNYQAIALPLFWYMAALTVLIICRNDLTARQLTLNCLLIVVAALIIARVHPMELLYYFCYFWIVVLFFPDRLRHILTKYWVFAVVLLVVFVAVIAFGVERQLPLKPLKEIIFAGGFNPLALFDMIMAEGRAYLYENLSRYPSSFSEAALFSLIAGLLSVCWISFDSLTRKRLNVRLFLSQTLATLLFFLIPLTVVGGGLMAMLTLFELVWRFFFAAPWFLLLPAVLYLLVRRLFPEAGPGWAVAGNVACILILVFISKGLMTGVLYENTRSILNALNPDKVGPYYTREDVARLDALISQKKNPDPAKPAIYYIRGDLAYLVRGCLRRYVYTSRLHKPTRESFFEAGLNRRYQLIDIDIGGDFPREDRIFRSFAFQ